MKHLGPGHSLRPAREVARTQARAAAAAAAAASAASAAGTAVAALAAFSTPAHALPEGWEFAQLDDGSLAVRHIDSDTTTALAAPPTTNEGADDE